MVAIIIVMGIVSAIAMFMVDNYLYRKTTASQGKVSMESESAPSLAETESLFRIAASRSEVRFSLGEELAGVPTEVIGSTNEVTGTIVIDFEKPQNAQVGEVLVNALTLETDSSFRNRAIQAKILETGNYKLIRFAPTEIVILPDVVNFGESISLEITGDLTIKEVTKSVTFTARITPLSETEIEGHAETMVAYADFGISIPAAPSVANVDDEVLLEIDFVALLDE